MAMDEFEVDGQIYRSRRMNARTQFHTLRRMAPILAPLQAAATGGTSGSLVALAEAIGSLSDEASDYVLDRCLEVVERKQGEAGWAKVKLDGGPAMFNDIDLMALLQIATNVLRANFQAVFQKGLALQSNGGASI